MPQPIARPIPFLLALLAACGGGGDGSPTTPGTPAGGTPTAIQQAGGSGQQGAAGTTLPQPVRVTVRDARGAGLSGVAVTWSASGNGSVSHPTSATDGSGVASVEWTLPTTAGAAELTATVGALTTKVAATAVAGPAASFTAADSVVLGTWGDTARPLAQARDRYGNVVGGITPTWSSSDTTVARVSAAGLVTSERAGVATLTATAGSATGTTRAVVRAQLNPACRIPAAPVARGATRGVPTFQQEAGSRFPANLLQYPSKDVVVVDFDRDGRSDVLVADAVGAGPGQPAGRLFAFRNTGSAFVDVTAATLGSTPITAINATFSHVADFTGDGLLDVFLGQSGYDSAPYPGLSNRLLAGTAGGTLQDVTATALPGAPTGFTHGAAIGDIDCDGDVDLVENDIHASATTVQSFRLQVNAGAGVFQERAAAQVPEAVAEYARIGNAAWLAVALCDLDRDGDPDLLAGSWYAPRHIGASTTDALFVNDGFGRFRRRTGALPAPTFGSTTDVAYMACADFDGDGWNDVVLAAIEKTADNRDAGGRIVFWHNERNMTFTDVTSAIAPNRWPAPAYPIRVAVADFNGDGWPDVLGTGYGSPWNGFWATGVGGNALFVSNGASGFAQLPLANWWGALWPVDVNADGKLDLLWAGAIQTPDQPPEALPRVYIQR